MHLKRFNSNEDVTEERGCEEISTIRQVGRLLVSLEPSSRGPWCNPSQFTQLRFLVERDDKETAESWEVAAVWDVQKGVSTFDVNETTVLLAYDDGGTLILPLSSELLAYARQ